MKTLNVPMDDELWDALNKAKPEDMNWRELLTEMLKAYKRK